MKSSSTEEVYQVCCRSSIWPDGVNIYVGSSTNRLRLGETLSPGIPPKYANASGCDPEFIKRLDFVTDSPIIVSTRLKERLEELCPEDVNFTSSYVSTSKTSIVQGFWVLEILHQVHALDRNESRFCVRDPESKQVRIIKGDGGDPDATLKRSVFRPGGLEGHHIAIEATWPTRLISETLKNILEKEFTGAEGYRTGDI